MTIPAGSTTATVPVTINANGGKHSGPIAFSLNLSNPVGAFVGNASGQGNIIFGGTVVNEFMAANAAMVPQSLETPQTAMVPVTLNGDYYAANCLVNTADGTATAANHAYTPIVNGLITFKANQAIAYIPVTIPAASAPTGNQTFTVSLSGCNPGTTAIAPVATVVIVGAAANGPSIEAAPSAVSFGAVPDGVTETRSFTLTNSGWHTGHHHHVGTAERSGGLRRHLQPAGRERHRPRSLGDRDGGL